MVFPLSLIGLEGPISLESLIMMNWFFPTDSHANSYLFHIFYELVANSYDLPCMFFLYNLLMPHWVLDLGLDPYAFFHVFIQIIKIYINVPQICKTNWPILYWVALTIIY